MKTLFLLLTLLQTAPVPQDTKPLQELVVPPESAVPLPAPPTPTILTPDVMYLIAHDKPLIIRSSTKGVVDISKPEPGPIKVRSIFANGTGKVETRNYTHKYIYTVTPIADGTTTLNISVAGATDETGDITRTVQAQLAPRPPPTPAPEPIPQPSNPLPTPKLRILIMYDTDDKLTSDQHAIIDSTIPQSAIAAAGGEWRAWDKTITVDKYTMEQWWKDALKRRPASTSPPKIIISSPKGFYEGDIPANVSAYTDLLKKYI